MLRIHAIDTEIRNTAYQPACLFLLCLNNLYTKKPRPSKHEGRGLNSRYHPDSRNTPGTQLMRNVHIRHSLQAILQECSSNGNLNSYLNLKRVKAEALRRKEYFTVRAAIAYQFGALLSYPQQQIEEMIAENQERERYDEG